MKKSLLSIALMLTSAITYAQVIFSVQSPSSIAGNYDMTYTDPGGGWGSPDLLDPLNAVTAELMFVEDGSEGLNAQGNPISREGCNPLINDLTGKIAVIYRNTCEFGTKVFNAQEAGAIAAIVVNREDATIAMGPGADGANVTIPAIFVSNITGQFFIDLLNAGETVTAFIGNKTGLFDNDLGMVKSKLLIPVPTTNPTRLVQSAAEGTHKLNAMIYNYGNNAQTNVSLKAEVSFGGNVIYSETVLGSANLASGDSVLVNLPDYSSSTTSVGVYTLTYTVTSDATDEYDADNTYSTTFHISDDLFSYGKLGEDGLPLGPSGYRASDATTSFGACIHFQDPNASRVQLEGVYFQASVNDPSVLTGQEFTIDVLSIDEEFTDLNTAPETINFTSVNTSSYIFQEELESVNVYAPFSSIIDIEDNKRYLVCITTFDANTFIGYSDLDFSWVVDTLNQPVSPVISNDAMNLIGFGEPAAAFGLKTRAVSNVPVVTSATGTFDLCIGETLTLNSSSANGNQWNLNGNPISGATSQSYIATTAGSYTVTANGETSVAVEVVEINCSGGVSEANIYNVSIYPNPANVEMTITADDLKGFKTITLNDQLGRTVSTWNINKDVMKLDVSKIATGNYILILDGAKGVSTHNVQIK